MNIGMTLLLEMEIKKVWSVNCLFCWKNKWRRCPLGWGIELCGSSSCLEGLRSLLNTEGILTLPMFLLSHGSLIQMWSASFAQWYRVLLSLSIIVKSFKFCFWVFCVDVVVSDGTGGLISMIWNSFFQGPVGFTYVFSCSVVSWAFPVVDYISFLCIWNWISLDAWVKTWWCLYL